jgi:hypothetical protein
MPMIDVYAAAGTFPDKQRLAQDLTNAVMSCEFGRLTRLSPSLWRPPEQRRVNFFGDLCVVTNIVVTHQRMCKGIS